ncbi:MAG TPA: hypothetical protein VM901_09460 [Bdellovibrionota bacterium]|jgi:nicotinate-nucleotide pyrophosphorylase (carboxylating)|nr:hypothetical protein [Bdellovibrionota bacterium]
MNSLQSLKARVQEVLAEDHVEKDLASLQLTQHLGVNPELRFEIIAKEDLIFCGAKWVQAFAELGLFTVESLVRDGTPVATRERVLVGRARLAETLSLERSLLNGMQRWSGVATLTHHCVQNVKRAYAQWSPAEQEAWPEPRVLHTRKTTPLWRDLEIEAVIVGGGHAHRASLAERPMVKENHKEPVLRLRGEWKPYLRQVIARHPDAVIEAETWSEAGDALDLGAQCLLLDNFSPAQLRAELMPFLAAHAGAKAAIEVSGGINPANLADYVLPGVSRISMGALTHSYRSADLSLNLLFEGQG